MLLFVRDDWYRDCSHSVYIISHMCEPQCVYAHEAKLWLFTHTHTNNIYALLLRFHIHREHTHSTVINNNKKMKCLELHMCKYLVFSLCSGVWENKHEWHLMCLYINGFLFSFDTFDFVSIGNERIQSISTQCFKIRINKWKI